MSLGDGVFKLKLYGVLSMVLCLTLIACFRSISINKENKISAYILLTILSISTLGFALLLHLIKNFIVKYTLPFIWITTALAFILLISIYGVWLAAYIIPFTLALCYVRIITNNKGFVTYSLLIINLCFCIGLSLKLISEGLY